VRGFGFFACFCSFRRALTRTSGANKYEGKKKERATHAGSLGEKAGDEIAVAAALRHSSNVNDTRRPVNRFIRNISGGRKIRRRMVSGFLYVYTAGRPNRRHRVFGRRNEKARRAAGFIATSF
jgi:hypothetical protein